MSFAKRTANGIKCNTLFRYVLQDHIWIGEIRSASYSQRGDMRNDRRERERDDGLTKSSNPSSVPLNSRSFFMMTQIFEPMHLSMSSASYQIPNASETRAAGVRT